MTFEPPLYQDDFHLQKAPADLIPDDPHAASQIEEMVSGIEDRDALSFTERLKSEEHYKVSLKRGRRNRKFGKSGRSHDGDQSGFDEAKNKHKRPYRGNPRHALLNLPGLILLAILFTVSVAIIALSDSHPEPSAPLPTPAPAVINIHPVKTPTPLIQPTDSRSSAPQSSSKR
jgi:hypothetical protein